MLYATHSYEELLDMGTTRVLWTLLLALTIVAEACGGRSAPSLADATVGDARHDSGKATFTCQPQPQSAYGCSAPDTTFGKVGDPGVKYAIGCEVIYPFPHPYYPSGPATCRCEDMGRTGNPIWTCPL
jgi:hypothetical protein